MLNNYVKLAWRNLRHNPLVTLLNITGLATGVAGCLFTALWVRREWSFDNFHPDAERIFRLSNTFKSETESFSQAPCGPAFGAHLPREVAGITSATRFNDDADRLRYGEKRFFEDHVLVADSNFLYFFHFPLKKGNTKEALKGENSIVLTEETAFKYFGDEEPLGKTMHYGNNQPMTVTGIVATPPPHSQIQFDVVIPMDYLKKVARENWGLPEVDNEWLGGWMMTYLKLANPDDWPNVEARINETLRAHAGMQMDSLRMAYTYHVQPIRDVHLRSQLRYDADNNGSLAAVWSFTAIGLIVLLLACINYMNLATAGSLRRAKETGLRKVSGAQREQLIAQFLFESLTVSVLATALGTGIFHTLLPGFEKLTGQTFDAAFSGPVVLGLAGFALFIGLAAGLYPAFVLSAFRPAGMLKGTFATSAKGVLLRKSLVVFQFAATVALLAGMGIVWRQMEYIRQKPLGYNLDAVVEIDYHGLREVRQRYAALRNELLQLPAIRNVAYHGANVVGGLGNGWTTTIDNTGKEVSTSLYRMGVSPEYFDTYGMELAAGRFFSGAFPTDTTKAVLVNEAAVRAFGWGTPENALGKPFGKGADALTVIGVVKDFHFETLHKPVEPIAIHFARRGGLISFRADAAQLRAALDHLEKTWKTLLPDVPLEYDFVDAQLGRQYAAEQTLQRLFFLLSGLALFIACLGLFGLSVFMASQRTKEIGIRKVLGASVTGITGLLARDFLKLVGLSVLIASPLAWWAMNRWLADFAYRIAVPWWIFAAAGSAAVLIAFLTVSFQSIKAALANPVKSLRSE